MLNRIEAKLIKLSQSFFYFFVTSFFFLIFLTFLKIKIEGKGNIPKKGRFILAANHQNFFDGFLVALITGPTKKISFVIAKRALRFKFFEILARLIGSVLIGGQIEDYQRALKKLNRVLSHGSPIGIFPEGDISRHVVPRRFKGGVAKLSLDSKTKVIPVYVKDTYNLRYFRYWLKRPQILLVIGEPLDLYNYAQVCGNNLDQMAMILREKIIELMGNAENQTSCNSNSLVSQINIPLKESV